jgi:hypothetical protein
MLFCAKTRVRRLRDLTAIALVRLLAVKIVRQLYRPGCAGNRDQDQDGKHQEKTESAPQGSSVADAEGISAHFELPFKVGSRCRNL